MWSRRTSTPRPISKDLDNFLYVYVRLLASMLYIYVCLSRSRLCHALCPPWACAFQSLKPLVYVVASVPLVVCLDVTACETHLHDVSVLDTHLSPLRAIMLCLPCLLCATRLAFFASLHFWSLAYICSCMSLCVVHTPISWNYGHPIQT